MLQWKSGNGAHPSLCICPFTQNKHAALCVVQAGPVFSAPAAQPQEQTFTTAAKGCVLTEWWRSGPKYSWHGRFGVVRLPALVFACIIPSKYVLKIPQHSIAHTAQPRVWVWGV